MMSIFEMLGDDWGSVKVYSHYSSDVSNLEDFVEKLNLSENDSIGLLVNRLWEDNLYLPWEVLDKRVQDKIDNCLQSIEEELGVVIKYKWDYYEVINNIY